MRAGLVIVFLIGILLSGCGKEGCTDPAALNYDENARRDDKGCRYPFSLSDLIGNWTGDEFCFDGGDTRSFNYEFQISEVFNQETRIEIYNLGQFEQSIMAYYEDNRLILESQVLGNYYYVEGEGFLQSDHFLINYDLINNSLKTNCQLSFQIE